MRLRNLYEVAVKPGERKGFSVRLKKLEDLQIKIADMQNTITDLKGTKIPDVLKKKMDDLINDATMEKEKLYSEVSAAERRTGSANGIPGNVMSLLRGIEKNSSIIMNAYRNTGKFLYRGIKSDDDALYGKPFDERRAKDSSSDLSGALNKALAAAGFTARRDNTSFTSGTYTQASNYGTVYIFFPRDGFHFHYSESIKDLVLDTGKLHLLLDKQLMDRIKKVLSDNWAELQNFFSQSHSPSDFMSGYSYSSDIKGIQQAVAAGKLPPEFEKFKTLDDFIDPIQVVRQMQYNQTDLDSAISSGHEVMVTGPYYALRADKFADYVKNYISMDPKASTVDLTPDTSTEKEQLDKKINLLLGQQPDGFLIGDWIQHKYEENIKGEVINNFYTNDFLLVKTYEGKMELVKNSNVTKIKTPTLPQYKPGDKLYVRSKGTNYSQFNNKYGKVISVDGPLVTISYTSYSGGTTSVPILLTEPAPKYDSENPALGDTVKVTGGDYDGQYGIITYVSSQKTIDVDFGDGDNDSVDSGEYTVIDPATKPVVNVRVPFAVTDFVEISGGGTWSSFVGIVTNIGNIKSKVQIMNNDPVFIANKRLNKIDQQEFESREFELGQEVTVTGGDKNYIGKTGKITYVYSTGTIEISMSDGSGYHETKFPNVKKINKDDVAPSTTDIDTDSGAIKVGDQVKIISGPDTGETGEVTKVAKAGLYIKMDNFPGPDRYLFKYRVAKIDDTAPDDLDGWEPDDVDFEKFEKPSTSYNPGNFALGDKVKIMSGPHEGKTASVSYIWSTTNKVDVLLDNDEGYETYPSNKIQPVAVDDPNKSDTFNIGDEVKIKPNGWNAGKTGKISYITDKKTLARVTFDDGVMEVYYVKDLELINKRKPKTKLAFKVGDNAKVKSGAYKDFEGTITGYEEDDEVYQLQIYVFGKDVTHSFFETELEPVKKESVIIKDITDFYEFIKQPPVKKLIKKGDDTGFITYAELNSLFPPDADMNADIIAEFMDMMSDKGVNIIDEGGMNQSSDDPPELLMTLVTQPERKSGLLDIFKDPAAKRLIKNAVDTQKLSMQSTITLFNIIGYGQYVDFVKPYLDLKGVEFES